MNNYEEDESLIRLAPDELHKYINSLAYYNQNKSDLESMYLVIDNCIELSENLPFIKEGYLEGMDKFLTNISDLIDQVKDSVDDKTLKSLLLDNRQKITEFMDRFNIEPSKDSPQDQYPQYQKYVKEQSKQLSADLKFKPHMDPSEAWGNIATQLRDHYAHPNRDPTPQTEIALKEGMKRLRENKEWSKKWSTYDTSRKEEELSLEKNPREFFRSKVLMDISSRIAKEGMHHG